MSSWYERLREIRVKRKLTQFDMSKVLDADMSTVSRYESGRGAKSLTRNMKRKLSNVFTPEEMAYIETGNNNIKIDKDFGICKVEEKGDIYCDIPKDMAMIIELLHELTTEQRRDVLRFVLAMDSK